MGTVCYPSADKANVEKVLFSRLEASQNPRVRTFVLWCLIKILSSSTHRLTHTLSLTELPRDSLDFKKNIVHFWHLWARHNNLLCEHILHNILLYGENNEYKMVLENYFAELFTDPQLFDTFYNFDLQRDRLSVIKEVLEYSSKHNKKMSLLLMEQLLGTVLANHPPLALAVEETLEVDRNFQAIGVFNHGEKKAFEESRSSESPLDNARFVYKHERFLSKERVSLYLTKEESRQTLQEYIKLLDVGKLRIEEALREVFFHLNPRESQQIYRVIEELCKVLKS